MLIIGLVLFFLLLPQCTSQEEQGKTVFVTIGTGGITGVYYPTGGNIAKMINKMNRSKMRNKIKLFKSKIKAGEIEEARNLFPEVIASIDKTISKGTIHQRTGARYKSRLNVLLMKSSAKT